MKWTLILMLLITGTSLQGQSVEDKINAIIANVDKQKQELTDTQNKLAATSVQLNQAESQITQVAQERDNFKQWGDSVQTKWVAAEARVSKGQHRIFLDDLVFAGLGLALLGFLGLKFGLFSI